MPENFSSTAAFIWSVADLLRGDFKQSQYGRIILPFTLLRRLECVLAPTKAAVLKEYDKRKDSDLPLDAFLKKAAKLPFYNTSPMDLANLGETQILDNLDTYIRSFSPDAREIFEHFGFHDFLEKLDEANLLYLVMQKFASMDLSPQALNNHHMGLVFEELIRRFAESSNETAGEHFRYILENDLLEAIVALPTDMFYNTGISTYVWILSNHKADERKGKVQLINASDLGDKMRKSLGSKRKYLTEDNVDAIVRLYGAFEESDTCKLFDTTAFGYRRITVERPLQLDFYPKDPERLEALQTDKGWAKLDESLQQVILDALPRFEEDKVLSRATFKKWLKVHMDGTKLPATCLKLLQKHLGEHDDEAEVCKTSGKVEPNPVLRDNENVPLGEDIYEYFKREVLPHVPSAWIDESKKDAQDGQIGIVGYEIPFNRHFYKYVPPRSLEEIDKDLDKVSREIMSLLAEVHA